MSDAAKGDSDLVTSVDGLHGLIDQHMEDDEQKQYAKDALADALGTDMDINGFYSPAQTIDEQIARDTTTTAAPAAATETQPDTTREPGAGEGAEPGPTEQDAANAGAAAAPTSGKTETETEEEPTGPSLEEQLAQERAAREALQSVTRTQAETITALRAKPAAAAAAETTGTETETEATTQATAPKMSREKIAEARTELDAFEADFGPEERDRRAALLDQAEEALALRERNAELERIAAQAQTTTAAAGDEPSPTELVAQVPALAAWKADAEAADAGVAGKSADMFEAAVALDAALEKNPEWQDKTTLERFQHVAKVLGGDPGSASAPAAETTGAEDPGEAAAAAAAAEAGKRGTAAKPEKKTDVDTALSQASGAPSSASSLSGGSPGTGGQTKDVEEMSILEMHDRFLGRPLDEIYGYAEAHHSQPLT